MLAANAHSGKNDEDKLDALLASLRDASVDPVLALLSALPPAPPLPAGDADADGSTKEIDVDGFTMECKCPRCGMEFDRPKE
jgi:ribosomal protein L12E/L44/L45/RPP1/RPP2